MAIILLIAISPGSTWANDTYICVENSGSSIINGGVKIHVGDVIVKKGLFEGFFLNTTNREVLDNEGNLFKTRDDFSGGLRMRQGWKEGLLGLDLSLSGGYMHQEFDVTNEEYAGHNSGGTLKRTPWFFEPMMSLTLDFKKGASFVNFTGMYRREMGDRNTNFFDDSDSGFVEFKVISDEVQNSYTAGMTLTFRKNAQSNALSIGASYSGYENRRETSIKQLIIDYTPELTEHPVAEVAKTISHRVTGTTSYYIAQSLSGTLLQFSGGWETVDSEIGRDPLDPPFDNSVFFKGGISTGLNSKGLEVGVSAGLFTLDKEGYELGGYVTLLRHVRADVSYGHAEYTADLGVNDEPFQNDWLRAGVIVSIFEL